MIRYPRQSRATYEETQRSRTAAKWTLNSITRAEVEWIHARVPAEIACGPILCLGVRNGLEVDLFRDVFGVAVQGVELHPQGARPDVWIGSFDAMPPEWAGRFALLYSNALDHAWEPDQTAQEWRRDAAPGAWLALTLAVGNVPTETDPIADIRDADLRDWFGGAPVASLALLPEPMRRVLWRLP